jgi:hypothetical protein
MAINVSFNGATIYKPGAYSKTEIDLGGGFPLSPTGIVAIFGESDAGMPGADEINIADNVYSPEQLPEIRNKYRSGNIVDAASFVFAPATDGAIPSGAQALYIYKTNASIRASLSLANSYGTLYSAEYGVGGNLITYRNILSAEAEPLVNGVVVPAFGAALNGATFDIAVNGLIPYTITLSAVPADHSDLANLVIEINLQLPADIQASAGTNNLILTMATVSNGHRSGVGRSFELIETVPADLAKFGLVAGFSVAASEYMSTLTVNQTRDLLTEEETLGGNVVLSIGCSTAVTNASVSIDDNDVSLLADASPAIVLPKSQYPTIGSLIDAIKLNTGWTALIADTLYNQLSVEYLDHVSGAGAMSASYKPARIKKDYGEIIDFFSNSTIVSRTELASLPNKKGLLDAKALIALAGGAKGATSSSDIVDALESFTKFRVNAVVPLFSRDATLDIADNMTDGVSSYTILGIHQALKTHLSLMATTKKKSERQGYASLKSTFDLCKSQVGLLASPRVQLAIQDIRQVDAQGNIKWFQPFGLSCILAGARCGCSIGTPLTFKYMNITGIRQTAQPMSTAAEDIVTDFDPDTQYDEAIQAGITFLEAPQSGGFRVVVDNTTYNKDGNWVYNRGNVLYAADVLAYDFRNQLENIYVGRKNTVSASEVKSTCDSILGTYLAQGITVSSGAATSGYKGLTVRIEGNTIYVNVTVVLVEGIDFILAEITLTRAQSQG